MALSDLIECDRTRGPRRVLLYGIRGIGTTMLAAGLPASVFVPCDGGTAHVDRPRFPVARRFGQVLSSLHELHVASHGYRTVVLDPLDALERLAIDEVGREHGIEQPTAAPLARGYALAVPLWRQLLDHLDALRADAGMHVVLVGPAQTERWTDNAAASGGGVIAPERYTPAIHRTASALLQGWCDEVLFAAPGDCLSVGNRPATPHANDTAGDGRVIHTRPARTHAAKNRLDLPPRLPMAAAALAPYFVPLPPPVPPPIPAQAAPPKTPGGSNPNVNLN